MRWGQIYRCIRTNGDSSIARSAITHRNSCVVSEIHAKQFHCCWWQCQQKFWPSHRKYEWCICSAKNLFDGICALEMLPHQQNESNCYRFRIKCGTIALCWFVHPTSWLIWLRNQNCWVVNWNVCTILFTTIWISSIKNVRRHWKRSDHGIKNDAHWRR